MNRIITLELGEVVHGHEAIYRPYRGPIYEFVLRGDIQDRSELPAIIHLEVTEDGYIQTYDPLPTTIEEVRFAHDEVTEDAVVVSREKLDELVEMAYELRSLLNEGGQVPHEARLANNLWRELRNLGGEGAPR